MAPVGFSVGRFRELIELATGHLLAFPRLPHAIKCVAADWIIPGDDELIERLFVFTDGSSVLSKGCPAVPASAGWGSVWLAKTCRVSSAFLGFCGGPAVCDQWDIGCVGPVIPSSVFGGVLALMWLLALVRRLPSCVAVENLCDCVPATSPVKGKQHSPRIRFIKQG